MSKILLVNPKGNKICNPIEINEPGILVTIISAVAMSDPDPESSDGIPIRVISDGDEFSINAINEYQIIKDGEVVFDQLVCEGEKIKEDDK